MCVNELDNVWEVKVISNSKIWTLTNQLLHLCATLNICFFFKNLFMHLSQLKFKTMTFILGDTNYYEKYFP